MHWAAFAYTLRVTSTSNIDIIATYYNEKDRNADHAYWHWHLIIIRVSYVSAPILALSAILTIQLLRIIFFHFNRFDKKRWISAYKLKYLSFFSIIYAHNLNDLYSWSVTKQKSKIIDLIKGRFASDFLQKVHFHDDEIDSCRSL